MNDAADEDARWTPELRSGDPELAELVERESGGPGGHHSLSVALVETDGVRFAGLGTGRAGAAVSPDTAFEIGSATKVLTGMLLASLAAAGTVSPEQPVAELLAGRRFTNGTTGSVTPAELASHRSGLPRLLRGSPVANLRLSLDVARGRDPYRGMGREDFLRRALRAAPAGPRGEFAYSNMGMALLGHALAEAAAPTGNGEERYAVLLERELLEPLGMAATVVRRAGVDAECAVPHRQDGRAVAPWVSPGYAPAGVGVLSTARDLARLLGAVLEGRAPGADAARPRFAAEGANRVGLGWLTLNRDGRQMTWHNGATGGSRSFVGFDRARGRAVAVLSNTDREVDTLGSRLVLHEG
ncbi:serine hydrolase domain-containing protein [Streptomyces sp. NPDC004111]|uniref:serine hydrolase domain-containing protein n=1 Tax=Streptomyces sp. NPDC004111 TaxID=3364690 RepID=UPI0036944258